MFQWLNWLNWFGFQDCGFENLIVNWSGAEQESLSSRCDLDRDLRTK